MSAPEPLSAERRAGLRAVAEAATPGERFFNPYHRTYMGAGTRLLAVASGWKTIAYLPTDRLPEAERDAAYIAAFDQSTVLALLDQADEAARLAGEVERLRAALEFYAERTHEAFRGTTGRWADYEAFPQPRRAIGGEPSMWDDGQIARAALTPPEEQ